MECRKSLQGTISGVSKSLTVTKGIVTRSKDATTVVAPGHTTTRSKKLLVTSTSLVCLAPRLSAGLLLRSRPAPIRELNNMDDPSSCPVADSL